MNNVLVVLEDKDLRNEFILNIKNLGENSKPVMQLTAMMESMNLFKKFELAEVNIISSYTIKLI
jgi:hypothetical protein